MTDAFTMSPIEKLTFHKIKHARADAFGAAILRSSFRRRHCSGFLRTWFNWMSWKKQGLSSCLHADLIPLIVTQCENRAAQVFKNWVAWSFVWWSGHYSKRKRQNRLHNVIVHVSRLHKLRSSISILHKMATFMIRYGQITSALTLAHHVRSVSRSFQGMFTWVRASKLARLRNVRLKIAQLYHWKDLIRANVERCFRHCSATLFLRCLRKWKKSVILKKAAVRLHSRAMTRSRAICFRVIFCSWRISYSQRLRAKQMNHMAKIDHTFQKWLMKTSIRKTQRLADIDMQNIFKQKLVRSAILYIASWSRRCSSKYHLLVSKELCQKLKVVKLTFFRTWAMHVFRKKDIAFQILMDKRIRISNMKMIHDVFLRWWIRMKQVSRARILQQRTFSNIKRLITTFWKITAVTAILFRSNSMDAVLRRRNKRLVSLVFSLWKIQGQIGAKNDRLLVFFDAAFFRLSRSFRAFLSSCRDQNVKLRLFFHRSVQKLYFHAWWTQSQKDCMLECAQILLTKMRTICQANMAVRHLLHNVKCQKEATRKTFKPSGKLYKPSNTQSYLSPKGFNPWILCHTDLTL
jgi:hypothetical protein